MSDVLLSTEDNPFNPHTQFDEWHQYDMQKGYHTLSFLARVCRTSPALSYEDQDADIDAAIDEIVDENILGIYVKVPAPS